MDYPPLRGLAARDFPPGRFQAADLLAFEYLHSNRMIAAAGPDKVAFDELRKPLQALLALQPKSGAAQWGLHDKKVIDEAWLDERSKYKPPR